MTIYDELPYPVLSYSRTHPAELATLATLHGMRPAPVQRCRVLEVGCARGGNIIPMALGLPGSSFVGIDLSRRQIEEGRRYVERLGLTNLRLEARDLMDFDDSFGEFDYVIAHGLYSWVPPAVRDRLFDVCRRQLAPQGVAFISFNAYPGWRAMSAIRDMLLYRVRGIEAPRLRAEKAREFLALLSDVAGKSVGIASELPQAYARFLQKTPGFAAQGHDDYLLYDLVAETNDPVYFHEFAAQAARHGLQCLCDSDFRASLLHGLAPDAVERVGSMAGDRIEREQYCDFLSNRMFRQSLVCRAGLPVGFEPGVEALHAFRYGSSASAEGTVGVGEVAVQRFVSSDQASLSTDHPLSKAALHHLIGLRPHTCTFANLLEAASRRLNIGEPDPASADDDIRMLASNLLSGFTHSDRLVSLSVFEPDFADTVSAHPLASAWARMQAEWDASVTTLRHERHVLAPHERILLPLLDGRRDVPALIEALLAGPVASGELVLKYQDRPVSDPAELRGLLQDGVEKALAAFAAAPLLLA